MAYSSGDVGMQSKAQRRLSLSAPSLLIGIAVTYLALVLLIPTIAVFYEAFHKGFETFLKAIRSPDFIHAVQMTLIATGISIPLNTIFGLCAAWVLARNRFPGRSLLISILDLPFAISPVVVGLMLVMLYGRNGWLGPILNEIGLKSFLIPPVLF